MNTTPDTETDEALDQLCEAAMMWEGRLEAPADFPGTLTEALAPIVAAIRRQAAADALKEQARRISKQASFYEEMRRNAAQKGNTDSYEIWSAHASQARNDATSCLQAAKDKIAEGYEQTCAARFEYTWTDDGHHCENPVPNEGDYCSKHEPEDEEDRWAE